VSEAEPSATLSESAAPPTRGKYFGPLEVRDGVAIIRLDGPEKMNTLGAGIMDEAQALWAARIENDPSVKAVVFISSKPDNFIAGADIQMIKTVANKDDLKALCLNGHDFFDRLKKKVTRTFSF
jgi:enoyl-CoA hydratase/carnithine racemase